MENTQLGTTIEQSEKLIKAGLSHDTADLHYNNASHRGPNYEEIMSLSNYPYTRALQLYQDTGFTENLFFKCIPAWSISKLWDILHENSVNTTPSSTTMNSERLLEFLVNKVIYSINCGYIDKTFLAHK